MTNRELRRIFAEWRGYRGDEAAGGDPLQPLENKNDKAALPRMTLVRRSKTLRTRG